MTPRQERQRSAVVGAAGKGIDLSRSVSGRTIGSWFNVMALVSCVLLAAVSAQGQTVTTTVTTGANPFAMAVNLVTDKIYVANYAYSNAASVTIIDGATNSTTTVTDTNAANPQAVAVNPVTNTIYVANYGTGNVTVIDGATATITTDVSVGTTPYAIAVNPLTNKIYIANYNSGNVTVIDGVANTVIATVAVGADPDALAVNPVTNEIYVANSGGEGSGSVSVINGATNAVTTTLAAGSYPQAIAVNPVTNKIYVANEDSDNVTVIDGATNTVTATVTDPNALFPVAVAVNPVTNLVYVANSGNGDGSNGSITVINGATNVATDVVDPNAVYPLAVAVNPVANKVYVANGYSDNVTVIDGATNSTTTITTPNASFPQAVGVNPVTNKVYVSNYDSTNVTVIDGDTNSVVTPSVSAGSTPIAVAANPVSNNIYVVNQGGNSVTVIAGATHTVTDTVSTGTVPWAVAANPVTNTIYVANGASNNVTVINGATDSTTTVTDPNAIGPYAVAVNPVTSQAYVANQGNGSGANGSVTVINGTTNIATNVVDPNAIAPWAVAVNPVTDTIYVANNSSGNVTVINGTTNTVTATVIVGNRPRSLAVNPVTNQIYVANQGNGDGDNGSVTVINGVTNGTTTVTDPNAIAPYAVAVNPVTNTVYVANNVSANVTVINGTTTTYTATVTDPNALQPVAVAVDPVTNHVYVVNEGSGENVGNVTVIDGATNTPSSVTDPSATTPVALALDSLTNQIFVANNASNNVTVIVPEQVQVIPIQTTITPLANNQTDLLATNFNFTATNNLTTAPIDNLLFQVDTWQAPWLIGLNQVGSSYTGTSPTLQPGFHILYAYSTDGEEAKTTNTGLQSSPLIGSITAYGFLVAAPEAGLSPSPLPFGNQALGTPSTAQTVTLTNSGTAGLNIATIALSGPNSGDFALTDNCVSPLTTPPTCTITLTFKPSLLGSESATLTVTDNSGDVSGSQQTVDLTGTGIKATTTTGVTSSANPSDLRQSVTFTATVTPQGSDTPTGTVTFNDGATALCTKVALASGGASCSTSTLSLGLHPITAIYSGDVNFVASTSPVLNQRVNQTTLTITASSSTTAYGTPLPAVTPSYSGFINGDTPASLTTPPTCATTGVPAGHPAGTYTGANNCSGAVDSNYTFNYVPGNVQITAVALTITASSGTFAYGGTVPAITPAYSGFVNGDTAASLTTRPTCSTIATSSSPVSGSPYASTCAGAVDGNYTISYVKGSVTETAAALAITASSGTFAYGGAVPAIIPGYSGFVNGDAVASLTTRPTCSTTATSSSPVNGSPYPSTCAGAVDGNYAITYVRGSVTESVAALTITASSGTFAYGGTVPAITPVYSGFVNGDTAARLSTQPTCSTTATSSSPVSSSPYPSTCVGAVDSNYTIGYVNGSVTESAAKTSTAITGIAPNPSIVGQPVTVSYTVTVNAPGGGTTPGTETVTVTDSTGASCKGTISAGNCALVPTAVGPDTLTATYSGDSNFGTSTISVTASFSTVPSLTLTGPTTTNPPTQPISVGVALSAPTLTALTGTLTLSFKSTAAGTPPNYIDPMTQFAAGGTTLTFTIPAGAAIATLPQNGAIQQGTTAGTIIVTLTSLMSGTATVALPPAEPSLSVIVPPLAPVISGSGKITGLSSTGFNVELDAYSTPRDLASATFTFQQASGTQLNGANPSPVLLNGVAPAWFSSSSGISSGGSFHLIVPFTFSGDTSALGSVTVTLSNSVGPSSPVTVTF